jgi:hypothetical protein
MGNHHIDCDYCGKDTRGLSGVTGCDTPREASRCGNFKPNAVTDAPGHGQAVTMHAVNMFKVLQPFENLYQQALEKGHGRDSTCEWRVRFNDLFSAHAAYEAALERAGDDVDLADEVDAKADEQPYAARWVATHVERLIDNAINVIRAEHDWINSVPAVPSAFHLVYDKVEQNTNYLWECVKRNEGQSNSARAHAVHVAVWAVQYMVRCVEKPSSVETALAEVRAEAMQATAKWAPMNSPHEAWAVLREEVDELRDECVVPGRSRSTAAKAEARQVAAMAVRYLVDICSGIRRV